MFIANNNETYLEKLWGKFKAVTVQWQFWQLENKSFQQQKLVFLKFTNDELQRLITSGFVIEEQDVK